MMTERTRLISYLFYGHFRVILKMNRIKKNTGSNFHHPRARGHSKSRSMNRNEFGDVIEIPLTMRNFVPEPTIN